MRILGIDPAPSKPTVACIGTPDAVESWEEWEPLEVADRVEACIAGGIHVLALWDAPLGLDQGPKRYSSRVIDAATRRWAGDADLTEAGAVGVANASGCPHTLLTQAVWDLPVGPGPRHGLTLVRAGTEVRATGRWLAETHPAVALAAWWSRVASAGPFPRYKPGGGVGKEQAATARARLLVHLEEALADGPRPSEAPPPPSPAGWSDDHVDAWVSWRLGVDLLAGRAHAAGPPGGGTYILPHDVHLEDGRQPTLRIRR